ncbi:uncharacterized protein PSFLO_04934 [Pseudozyma flocculosa]|uniref:Uncharacterized protein n=1 Tax=Pseudozyma flocculosa TaxID=84751 RepID=A0A5C3F4L6_9BASI|nr:uncharacterized protein PSFLO_04934 [Pseudozyma flocculosa]
MATGVLLWTADCATAAAAAADAAELGVVASCDAVGHGSQSSYTYVHRQAAPSTRNGSEQYTRAVMRRASTHLAPRRATDARLLARPACLPCPALPCLPAHRAKAVDSYECLSCRGGGVAWSINPSKPPRISAPATRRADRPAPAPVVLPTATSTSRPSPSPSPSPSPPPLLLFPPLPFPPLLNLVSVSVSVSAAPLPQATSLAVRTDNCSPVALATPLLPCIITRTLLYMTPDHSPDQITTPTLTPTLILCSPYTAASGDRP